MNELTEIEWTDLEGVKRCTPRERQAVIAFTEHLNKSQAMVDAGYSENTAYKSATEFFNRPHVRAHVQHFQKQRSMRAMVNADRVLEELARMAFIDHAGILEKIGENLRKEKGYENPFDGLSQDERACIAGVKPTDNGLEIKFHSKEKSIEMLSKHLKLFSDGADVNVNVTQMGRVTLTKTDNTGTVIEEQALTFDVGSDPDDRL